MKKIFMGCEFEEVEFMAENDTEIQSGLLVHDLHDENHDGDAIYGNGVAMPETDDDAAEILEGEYGETSFTQDADGIYMLG